MLNHPGTIKKGYTPILNVHTASVACKFVNIKERCDRRTGQKAEDSPSGLTPGQVGVVELAPLKPISLESFFDYPSLGRFVIRDLKQTVAVGVIISIDGRVPQTDDDKLMSKANAQANSAQKPSINKVVLTQPEIANETLPSQEILTPTNNLTQPTTQVLNTFEQPSEETAPVLPKTEEEEIVEFVDIPQLMTNNDVVNTDGTEDGTHTTMSGKLESEL